jgi:hypothetical protein
MREFAWLCRQQSRATIAKIFQKKKQALEAILDSEDELEPAKAEALSELVAIEDLQRDYLRDCSVPVPTAERISKILLSLYKSMATAVDPLGNPQPTVRAFAFYILVTVLMPSLRASATYRQACFVYEELNSPSTER